jgi:hypothetical protein
VQYNVQVLSANRALSDLNVWNNDIGPFRSRPRPQCRLWPGRPAWLRTAPTLDPFSVFGGLGAEGATALALALRENQVPPAARAAALVAYSLSPRVSE